MGSEGTPRVTVRGGVGLSTYEGASLHPMRR